MDNDSKEIRDDQEEFEDMLSKYTTVAEDIKNAGYEMAGEVMLEMVKQIDKFKNKEDKMVQRINEMDGIIGDLTLQLGDATVNAEHYYSNLRSSTEENSIIKKELDIAHLREQDYQELIDSLRSQTEFLESEMDKVKKEQDDLATELGISGRTKEAFYKEREKLKKENASLKSELGSIEAEKYETTHQLDQTKTDLILTQQQLDELKLLNEELHRDKGYMSKEAAMQRSLVHQLKKNLILLKSHHDFIRKQLDDTNTNFGEQKAGMFAMQHVNKELRNAIRNDQEEISNLNRKIYDLMKANEDYKSINTERDKEMLSLKKRVNDVERRERCAIKKLKRIEIKKERTTKENIQLAQVRKSTEWEITGMKSQKYSMKQAFAKLNRDYLLVSAHLLKTTHLAADIVKKLELELRVRRTIELERDQLKNEVHKYFIINLGLMSQKDRCTQENTQLEQKLEEELLYIRHKEHNIADLKKEMEEQKMKMKKNLTLYDEIKAERNVIARGLAETQDMNDELKKHNKTLSKQLDQLKEQMTMKDSTLVKAERTNKRKMNEGVKLKWQLTKSRNLVKACKDAASNIEKDQAQNMRILEKALKERNTVNKSLSKAVNEKAVILTQLDRKTAELNCLSENVNFMDIILKKGDRQYNQRLDDIRILRLEVLKLRRENAMVVKALDNSADLRKEVYHLYAELNRERTRVAALEQEIQTPVNYHRWRILQGTNPDHKDLIDKVGFLQKELIKSREELSNKHFEIDELKATEEEMKSRMERMPGFDVYETISSLRTELANKDDEVKTLSSVLACSEFELNKLRLNDKMNSRSLNDFKKKYFELKNSNDRNKAMSEERASPQQNCKAIDISQDTPKKTGLNEPSINISCILVQPICCN